MEKAHLGGGILRTMQGSLELCLSIKNRLWSDGYSVDMTA